MHKPAYIFKHVHVGFFTAKEYGSLQMQLFKQLEDYHGDEGWYINWMEPDQRKKKNKARDNGLKRTLTLLNKAGEEAIGSNYK